MKSSLMERREKLMQSKHPPWGTFAVIFLGYASTRAVFGVRASVNTLDVLVTRYCLPALVFSGLVSLDMAAVSWAFIGSVAMSKILVLIITTTSTILFAKGTREEKLGKAGIRSMFCTLSNDFALGVPLFRALFPTLTEYIYLVSPIQMVIINPVVFVLIELAMAAKRRERHAEVEEENEEALFLRDVKIVCDNNTDPNYSILIIQTDHSSSYKGGALLQRASRAMRSIGVTVSSATVTEDSQGHSLDVVYIKTEKGDGTKLRDAELDEVQNYCEAVLQGRAKLRDENLRRNFSSDRLYPEEPADIQDEESSSITLRSRLVILFNSLVSTPLIYMTVLGILGNLLATYLGYFPKFILQASNFIGDAYAPLALFSVGNNLRKFATDPAPSSQGASSNSNSGQGKLSNMQIMRLVFFVVLGKVVLVAFFCVMFTFLFSGDGSLSAAAFVYGMLPTGPTVASLSSLYGIDTTVMAAATFFATVAYVPMSYLGQLISTIAMSEGDIGFIENIIVGASANIGIVAAVSALWTLAVLLAKRAYYSRRIRLIAHILILIAINGVAQFAFGVELRNAKSMQGEKSDVEVITFAIQYGSRLAVFVLSAISIGLGAYMSSGDRKKYSKNCCSWRLAGEITMHMTGVACGAVPAVVAFMVGKEKSKIVEVITDSAVFALFTLITSLLSAIASILGLSIVIKNSRKFRAVRVSSDAESNDSNFMYTSVQPEADDQLMSPLLNGEAPEGDNDDSGDGKLFSLALKSSDRLIVLGSYQVVCMLLALITSTTIFFAIQKSAVPDSHSKTAKLIERVEFVFVFLDTSFWSLQGIVFFVLYAFEEGFITPLSNISRWWIRVVQDQQNQGQTPNQRPDSQVASLSRIRTNSMIVAVGDARDASLPPDFRKFALDTLYD